MQRRTCPNPKSIQEYLVENSGFEGTIPEDGKVCPPCYKVQLLILKQKPKSTDADLQALISDLKQQMMDTNDSGERAMQTTAIYVAERLLKQECLLLPTVKQKYCFIISKMTQKENQPVQNKPTTQWLLSNLVVYLQHHLSYKCSVRKHGTLLYRSNGNLHLSISHLLYKTTLTSEQTSEEKDLVSACAVSTEPCNLDDLNSLLHKEIKRYLAADLSTPYPFHAVNIKRLVSEIDQTLWTFITSITRSFSERRGYNTKAEQPHTTEYHVKQVRQLFRLSALMFCTDDRCSVPFSDN